MARPLAAGPMRSQGRSLLVCRSMSPGISMHRACRADVLVRPDGGMHACDAPIRDHLVPPIADRYPIGNSSFQEATGSDPPADADVPKPATYGICKRYSPRLGFQEIEQAVQGEDAKE